MPLLAYLLQNIVDVVFQFPFGIMAFEFRIITDIPDMIPYPVFLNVFYICLFPCYLLELIDGFQYGYMGIPASANIIDFSYPWFFVEMIKGIDKVIGMDIITNLLAFITKNSVLLSGSDTFAEIG